MAERRRRRLVLLLLIASLAPAHAVTGQVSQANERRVVDRAERLAQSGRPEEARAELAGLLERAPAAPDALRLMYDLTATSGDPERFVPYAEAAMASAGPPDDRVRDLWVRGLARAGLADSARAVAARWVAEDGANETALLALAAAQVARGEPGDAVSALRVATARGFGTRAIHTRLGDLLVDTGRIDEAVSDAWVPLLSFDEPAIDVVAEDIARAAEPDRALTRLVEDLEWPGPAARAGALLAVRLGHDAEARRLAEHVGGEDRAQFLRDYVREAELADRAGEAAWAAGELVSLSPRPVDRMRWLAMAADRSLVAGDTAAARDALEALADGSEPGDGPHDASLRRLFELMAADPAQLDDASALLDRYGADYPDSIAAQATMYGQLAAGHARAGDLATAANVVRDGRDALSGPSAVAAAPPLDAAAGRLAFWGGRRDSAVALTGRSLVQQGLPAAERTRRIRLLSALEASDSTEAVIVGGAALGLHRDPASFDLAPPIAALLAAPSTPGRAATLAYLGDLAAEAGRSIEAIELWRRVAEGYPDSPETPGAILALARATPREEAVRWLEQLIVGYPESALAPVARRMLAELSEGGTGVG